MSDQQLDLFSDHAAAESPPPQIRPPVLETENMDDEALIAAIPTSILADSAALAAEAGRRRLAAAVPALVALCRRFAGFGRELPVPEQAAALQGLVMIGGREAARAVGQMLERAVVQGPTLKDAVAAAARLRTIVSHDLLKALLQHPDPDIRADACRCARPAPELVSLLIDLLGDLHPTVAKSAACALGQMGRVEARPMLTSLLREGPTEEVIDSVSSIADEECMVLLGRIARSFSELSDAALDALDSMDDAHAGAIAAAIRDLPRP